MRPVSRRYLGQGRCVQTPQWRGSWRSTLWTWWCRWWPTWGWCARPGMPGPRLWGPPWGSPSARTHRGSDTWTEAPGVFLAQWVPKNQRTNKLTLMSLSWISSTMTWLMPLIPASSFRRRTPETQKTLRSTRPDRQIASPAQRSNHGFAA